MDDKPLEFIQAIIARMANNGTQMKTWNVALATAVIGFIASKEGRPADAAIYSLVPSLAFWTLDAYYLALEFRFRELYEAKVGAGNSDYQLLTTPVDACLFIKALFRPSVFLLHAPVFITIWWVARMVH